VLTVVSAEALASPSAAWAPSTRSHFESGITLWGHSRSGNCRRADRRAESSRPAGLTVLTPGNQAIGTGRLEPRSEPIALGVLRRRNAGKLCILSHAIAWRPVTAEHVLLPNSLELSHPDPPRGKKTRRRDSNVW